MSSPRTGAERPGLSAHQSHCVPPFLCAGGRTLRSVYRPEGAVEDGGPEAEGWRETRMARATAVQRERALRCAVGGAS